VKLNIHNILAFAKAERRISFRLTRYWAFLAVAYLTAIGMLVVKTVWHSFGSSVSASVGLTAPRFNFIDSGLFYLIVFIIGLLYLAFDIRERDKKAQLTNVLDARPYKNIELILGRFTGLMAVVWLPLVLLIFILEGINGLLLAFGSPFGGTIEPVSIYAFPFFTAFPAMAFSCALVIFISLLIRHQYISLYISSAILGALVYLASFNTLVPLQIAQPMDLTGSAQSLLSTDWYSMLPLSAIPQRLAFIFAAFSLLVFASYIHPRRESKQGKFIYSGATLAVLSLSLFASVFAKQIMHEQQFAAWQQAHAPVENSRHVDIESMTGTIEVQPGQTLRSQLTISFTVPEQTQQALLTLNPGLTVTELKDQQGADITYQFEQGLLQFDLANLGREQTILIKYKGRPDTDFAYLDSYLSHTDLLGKQHNVALLGSENSIYHPNYVALMPGVHWLPKAGTAIKSRQQPAPDDHFAFSADITVPNGWIVAAPGKRQQLSENATSTTFRFNPKVKLAQVPLISAPFRQLSREIDGIEFEMLLHPDHTINLATFDKASPQIVDWISNKLSLAREAGLVYPFDAFYLIEVPNSLRTYQGGWRNDTALAPPSMVLMRENSLPTARFDFDARATFGYRAMLDQENGFGIVTTNRLIEFFKNDYTGGNVFTGIAQSYFSHQLSATGEHAIALDYIMNQLTSLVLSEQKGYFSAAKLEDVIAAMLFTMGTYQKNTIDERMVNSYTNDAIWSYATKTPLTDMTPWQDPVRSLDLLALKGGAMAQLIYDKLGPIGSGQLIAKLLENNQGNTFTLNDLLAASDNVNLNDLITQWLNDTHLPGFVNEGLELYQLPLSQRGESRYQLKLRVRNDEPVTGYFKLSWFEKDNDFEQVSQPIRVPAGSTIEYATVLSSLPEALYLDPYVSLNRSKHLLQEVVPSDIVARNEQPVQGTAILETRLQNDRIVIDDLDDQFYVEDALNSDSLRVSSTDSARQLDNGLPVVKDPYPANWSRKPIESAWGKYRKTTAYIGAGDGAQKAIFPAQITEPGLWQIEIHLPNVKALQFKKLGDMEVTVTTPDSSRKVDFNTSLGNAGWNKIGEFTLPKGVTKVEISSKTTGKVVFADAVAWSKKAAL